MRALNGWERIGVIRSVLWIVATPLTYRHSMHEALRESLLISQRLCEQQRDAACWDRAYDDYAKQLYAVPWVNAEIAISAVVPIVALWLLAYALVWLVRWVGAGFIRTPLPK